jgi:Cu+-exporting ATPase
MSTVKDPVCNMNVDPERARGGSFAHEGTTYFFCIPKCRERFAADPARYLHASVIPIAVASPAHGAHGAASSATAPSAVASPAVASPAVASPAVASESAEI